MKNLKKLLAALVSATMVISSFAMIASAKSYPDVPSDNAYYEAVSILSAMGIVQGDSETGNYRPNDTLKRSEAAAILIRATGNEAAAAGSANNQVFTDVATDHWAAGYINCAANLGIIAGLGDGTFAPDANVKYQEFVKMLVAACGYTPMAERRGGYPTGYLVVGASYGVTKGLNVGGETDATRGIVAQLAYNGLDVAIMEQTGYGSYNEEYTIYDGKNGNDKRTLASERLDIVKAKASVVANNRTSVEGSAISRKKDVDPQVRLLLTDLYDVEYEGDYYLAYDANNNPTNKITAFVGESNADEYLGYDVITYLKDDENDDPVVLAIVPEKNKSDELIIRDDIEVVENIGTSTNDAIKFEYWEDKATDRDTTKLDIARNAAVIVNGTYIGNALESRTATFDGVDINEFIKKADEVKLVGPSNDDYNKIFVTKYAYEVVDEVRAEDLEVRGLSGNTVLFESQGNSTLDLDYTITLDGEDITLADIEKNDVLNIVYEGNDPTTYEFMDVIVTRSPVEGVVSMKYQDPTTNEYEFTIGDAKYKTVSESKADEISLNDEGVYFISVTGKIVDFDLSASLISDNYGFVTEIGRSQGGFGYSYEVKLFTKEGTLVKYTLADKVRVNDYSTGTKVTTNYYNEPSGSQADIATLYGAYAGYMKATASGTSITDAELANLHFEKRLVTYKTDKSGELCEINIAGMGGANVGKTSIFNGTSGDWKYRPEVDSFGSYEIKDGSVLFYAAPVLKETKDAQGNVTETYWAVDSDSVELRSFSGLDDETIYENSYIFDVDTNLKFNAALITMGGAASAKDALAVVESVAEASVDGTEVSKITFMQSGELKSYIVSDTNLRTYKLDGSEGGFDETDLSKGDIFQYARNNSDEIYSITKIYDAATRTLTKADGQSSSNKITYAFGFVTKIDGSSITLSNKIGETAPGNGAIQTERYSLKVPEGGSIIRYEESKNSNYLTALNGTGSIRTTNTAGTRPYLAVIRLDDGIGVDIVQIVCRSLEVADVPAFENSVSGNMVIFPGTVASTATPIPDETPAASPSDSPAASPSDSPAASPSESPAGTTDPAGTTEPSSPVEEAPAPVETSPEAEVTPDAE